MTRKSVSQQGFTLLEVLVAIIVLSIGLLGLAALQATAMRNNNSAYMRSQATFLVHDLVERVRANADIDYISAMENANSHDGDCLDQSTGCTATQMAQYDTWLWMAQVSSILPLGEGIICLDDSDINDGTGSASDGCSGSGDMTIKVWWDDDMSGTADQLFAMSFQR